jgi:diguanylate cyclase (GGDEF)-like protein
MIVMASGSSSGNRMITRLISFLQRFSRTPASAPLYEQGRLLVLLIIALLALAVFTPVAVGVIRGGNVLDGIMLLIPIVFQWVAMGILPLGRSSRPSMIISSLSISFALVYGIVDGGFQGYGILYIFLSPIIFFYLLEIKLGALFTLVFSLLIGSTLLIPSFPVREELNSGYLLRILILYVLMSAITAAVIAVFRRSQDRLQKYAFYDDLTDLPNRYLIRDSISTMLNDSYTADANFAVFFISISHFRNINDNYGYEIGDQVIEGFACHLRERTPAQGFCGRFGGTDFIIAYPLRARILPETFAEKLHDLVKDPFEIGELKIRMSLNISFLEFPAVRQSIEGPGALEIERPGWIDADWIIKNLEVALENAKGSAGGQTIRYDARGHRDIRKRYLLAEALRNSLKQNEISMHYQPIISAMDLSIRKFEVLARWNSYSFGSISPVMFIPMAEELGLIREISDNLFTRAAAELRRLEPKTGSGENPPLGLALNLSPLILQSRSFIPAFKRILDEQAIDPKRIELEITESVLLQHEETAIDNLNQLVTLGIKLALDDFGTGYSSLSYLQRFSVSTIKIDRSFIMSMHSEGSSLEIVRAVIAMAKSLGIRVVAEGVEYAEQFRTLRDLGCDYIQGFYFSRPLPAEELPRWIEDWNRRRKSGEILGANATGDATGT